MLQKSRGIRRSAAGTRTGHSELKVTRIDKIHKSTCSQIQGECFFRGLRSAAGSRIGPPKLKVTKIDQIQKVRAPKFQGHVFLMSHKRSRPADWAAQAKSKPKRKVHRIHAPKFQEAVFLRLAERYSPLIGHTKLIKTLETYTNIAKCMEMNTCI